MRSPAFQFYADDFLAGTADMTDAEVGLYVRLLCAQWSRGSLPDDLDELLRFSRGSTTLQAERVRQKFAVGEDGRLRNVRLETERAKQSVWREKSRLGGQKSAITRNAGKGGSTTLPTKDQPPGQPNANTPSPSPSPNNTTETPSATRFGEFWEAYPKKVAKDQAKAKFERLSANDQSACIARVRVESGSEQWTKDQGKFIPNPTTYLNQRRWEAVVDLKPKQDGLMFGMTEEEILRQAL